MCKCTPAIRTPYCGKEECAWPGSKPEGARSSAQQDVEEFIADKQRSVEWVKTYEDKYNLKQMIPVSDFRSFIAKREAGHVRVPVEPTEAMIEAGCKQHECQQQDTWYGNDELSEYDCKAIYKAMINASKGEK